MKKVFTLLVSAMMVFTTIVTPIHAEESTFAAQLHARVTDAGQVVNKMVINYGEGAKISGVDTETYTVHVKASTEAIREGTDVMSWGDYDIDRDIVKVEAEGNTVTIYFNEAQGATLAYLSAGRNYPADLTYTVTQNKAITSTAADGRDLEIPTTTVYTINETIVDEETAKFESVLVEGGINYQFYDAPNSDTLVVWFHGNGEGDFASSNNNVSQMLANRGTVAWATEENQAILGNAHVMAFQAPDHWYNAKNNGLLEMAYNEITDVMEEHDIDKVIVSGCSAGGFMTTRMIIAYPELFDAAIINCPALDIANDRAGVDNATPTDEELASIKDSDTAIWLVQGETDSSVKPADCSWRLFNILTEGQELTTTVHEQELNSDFTTYETADNKYKLSIYETVNVDGANKLEFAEDYDQDGVDTLVQYSDHWSWIFSLNNNPVAADGTHIINWAAEIVDPSQEVEATATIHARVTDAGEMINKMVIEFAGDVTGVTKDTFSVHAIHTVGDNAEGQISYGEFNNLRNIVKVEAEGNTVTIYFDETQGGTLSYLVPGARNYPTTVEYTLIQNESFEVDGVKATVNCTVDNTVNNPETEKFESVLVEDGINYQFYNAGEDAEALIVWFHGNGEGDFNGSNNNVAQMLANRGTVAWATEEAQAIFGKAHVMSFQAPDHWYNAKNNGLLEMAYAEIMEVVEAHEINPENILVSGCSAGGFMTTRMIIAYPDLFAAAMINCPALDIANDRAGVDNATPTDEELQSIKDSRTAIWLVQGKTDSSVKPADCSWRLFNILTDGEEITESVYEQELNSDFTTYETADNKYKLSIYETVNVAGANKLEFAEDYDQDGVNTLVQYSDHWSWIYTLNNNPTSSNGTHIWNWAAGHIDTARDIEATAKLYGEVTDAGQVVYEMVIELPEAIDNIDIDTFTVHAEADTSFITEGTDVISYGDYSIDRTITNIKVEGTKVTITFSKAEGATLAYLSSARNFPANLTYTVTTNSPLTVNGEEVNVNVAVDTTIIDEETAKFESVLVEDGINYQFYDAGKKADSLIVWFHGNGEGDYLASDNNVAQMLANRGTVAWATKEAQDIFGGAHVMSFQAPDTWYYAQNDGLLAMAHDEIMEVVEKYGIDKDKILVSGCSAGGYMTTRMIIAYPDLFAAAMINCPALDVADARGGETPTDEELASIKDSRTAIWLVQGETDATVNTEACSKRLFNILTEGKEIVETRVDQEIQSGFTTYETADGKYLMSLYDTTEANKLHFAEDYNNDGVLELVEYSNHWSWIYTLRNNPTNAKEVSIWQWASNVANPNGIQTGDNANIMPYVALAMLSLVGVAFIAYKKRKEVTE